jgi:hypothetical protein
MVLPPVFSYWREFAARYVTAICTQPDFEASQLEPRIAAPSDAELDSLALGAPPMIGAERRPYYAPCGRNWIVLSGVSCWSQRAEFRNF